MVKLYLAIVLSVCLAYVAFAQESEETDDRLRRGADWHQEENNEDDLYAHLKEFKKLLLNKKKSQNKVSAQVNYKSVFVQVSCESNTCPKDCPGQCGSYQGSLVCQCKSVNFVNPCTKENVAQGFDLHPYKPDQSKYLQCGPAPGLVYIKSCPHGLVYDERRCYCNYPWALH